MSALEDHQYAIIQNENGEVLWIKSVSGKKKFMLPGGTSEKGETPKDALKREVFEETGFVIEVGELIHEELLENRNPPHQARIYFCKIISGELKLSSEHDEYMWAKPEETDSDLIAHPDLFKIVQKACARER